MSLPPTMLPVELIDHILSFLGGDLVALNACLNGHPLLSRLAEPYYYADTVIIVTQDNFAVSSFYENISQNPHILDYLRTLEIRAHSHLVYPPLLRQDSRMLSIISMIPRMTNLTLLKLGDILFGGSLYGGNDFYTAFRACLQHSSVEQLCLDRFPRVALSVLDNCKNIKTLTLSYCRGLLEPVSISTYQLLETLVIRSLPDISLFVGMTSRVPNLKSLQLRGLLTKGFNWNGFPELLGACSSSLTELHIDVGDRASTHVWDSTNGLGNWFGGDQEFPFTLSRHKSLKRLSIAALVFSSDNATTRFALPAIMKLIKTAPRIQDVVLRLHWMSINTNSFRRLDWSPLIQLQSAFPTACPRIHLRISIGSSRPDIILDALAENEPLMSLVKRGVVIFKPLAECPDFF